MQATLLAKEGNPTTGKMPAIIAPQTSKLSVGAANETEDVVLTVVDVSAYQRSVARLVAELKLRDEITGTQANRQSGGGFINKLSRGVVQMINSQKHSHFELYYRQKYIESATQELSHSLEGGGHELYSKRELEAIYQRYAARPTGAFWQDGSADCVDLGASGRTSLQVRELLSEYATSKIQQDEFNKRLGVALDGLSDFRHDRGSAPLWMDHISDFAETLKQRYQNGTFDPSNFNIRLRIACAEPLTNQKIEKSQLERIADKLSSTPWSGVAATVVTGTAIAVGVYKLFSGQIALGLGLTGVGLLAAIGMRIGKERSSRRRAKQLASCCAALGIAHREPKKSEKQNAIRQTLESSYDQLGRGMLEAKNALSSQRRALSPDTPIEELGKQINEALVTNASLQLAMKQIAAYEARIELGRDYGMDLVQYRSAKGVVNGVSLSDMAGYSVAERKCELETLALEIKREPLARILADEFEVAKQREKSRLQAQIVELQRLERLEDLQGVLKSTGFSGLNLLALGSLGWLLNHFDSLGITDLFGQKISSFSAHAATPAHPVVTSIAAPHAAVPDIAPQEIAIPVSSDSTLATAHLQVAQSLHENAIVRDFSTYVGSPFEHLLTPGGVGGSFVDSNGDYCFSVQGMLKAASSAGAVGEHFASQYAHGDVMLSVSLTSADHSSPFLIPFGSDGLCHIAFDSPLGRAIAAQGAEDRGLNLFAAQVVCLKRDALGNLATSGGGLRQVVETVASYRGRSIAAA